jgi:hypothetical protein
MLERIKSKGIDILLNNCAMEVLPDFRWLFTKKVKGITAENVRRLEEEDENAPELREDSFIPPDIEMPRFAQDAPDISGPPSPFRLEADPTMDTSVADKDVSLDIPEPSFQDVSSLHPDVAETTTAPLAPILEVDASPRL